MSPPAAVTGFGLITPAGRGLGPAWDALCRGEVLLGPDEAPALVGFAPIATARSAPLDPDSLGADRRAARIMGHHTHMLLACVSDAAAMANVREGVFPAEEIGFYAGMEPVDPLDADLAPAVAASRGAGGEVDYARFFSAGMGQIHPLWPLGMLNAIGFCQTAIQFGLRGDNAVFSPGPEAAAQALAEAADSLLHGRARAAFAAGVSTVVSLRSIARHRKGGLLRPPAGREADFPRPYSASGAPALGEGAGVLLLESPDSARDRGARPLGALAGWGASRDMGRPGGLRAAIQAAAEAALRRAGRAPGEISLVLPHAEGRKEGDASELEALSRLLGGHRPWGLVTKGAFGHLLGAAPAVDAILALHALAEGTVPPSPGTGGEAEGVLRIPPRPERMEEARAALVLGRGSGGACAAIVLERASG